MDNEAWAIRHLVVNTSDWWLGYQMLVAIGVVTMIPLALMVFNRRKRLPR